MIQEGMPRRSRVSIECIQNIINDFVGEITARNCAQLCSIRRTTATHWYHRLRIIMFDNTTPQVQFSGEIVADKSYFGGKKKGKRGREAKGKQAVFGIYKRNGYVHAVGVCNTKSYTLSHTIHEILMPIQVTTYLTHHSFIMSE